MGEKREVTAAVIVIGNEILSGRTKDQNIGWIAEKLTGIGINVREARVIPDIEDVIIDAVNTLRAAHDYVFTTGGIGPTHDDITADSIAKAFGVESKTHDEAYQILLDHYGEAEFTPARQRMAKVPVGAVLVPNPVSGAPGFLMDNVYVMAGVPRIMQAMLDSVASDLQGGDKVLSASVSCKLPESQIADDLRVIQERYPDIDIGSYPSFHDGKVGVSAVIRSTDEARMIEVAEAVVEIIRNHGQEPITAGF